MGMEKPGELTVITSIGVEHRKNESVIKWEWVKITLPPNTPMSEAGEHEEVIFPRPT